MLMPGSSLSKDPLRDQEVYFIHDLGYGRSFWALWSNFGAYQAYHAPLLYRVVEEPYLSLRRVLLEQYPQALELDLPTDLKRQAYRQIRRAELPESVREKIRLALLQAQQKRLELYLSQGFEADDLLSLKRFKRRYRQLARIYHPDYGGSSERFMLLQETYQQACRSWKF